MKTIMKYLHALLSIIIIFTLFGGCSGKTVNITETVKQNTQTSRETGNGSEDLIMLPIVKSPIKLKYWVVLANEAIPAIKSFDENEVYKELERRTGIKVEFIHTIDAQKKEQFNLMVASNDLPDIIEGNLTKDYPGGVEKAISDGIYLKLNEHVNKYAPNFKKLLKSNPEIEKQTVLHDGTLWCFPCIQKEEEPPWKGPYMRGDWLEDLGFEVPTTLDEWYTVLRAFKEKKGATAPLLAEKNGMDNRGASLLSAYGLFNGFLQKEGKVIYGPIEPQFKDFLTTVNKWYSEGLIDKNFPTRDKKSYDAMITYGKAGAWFGSYGETDTYMLAAKDESSFKIVPLPYPTLKPGDKVHFRQTNFHNKEYYTIITTACKNVSEAVKWLDYHYSDEGALLINYGIKDVSYTMENGEPKLTDFMLKNPKGLSFLQMAWIYKIHMAPYLREPINAYYISDLSRRSMEVWGQAGKDYNMPLISLTVDENLRQSSIMSSINAYKDEMILKFMLGIEPLSKYDEYVNQMRKMGIDDVVKIQQTALDRYNT